MFFLTGRQEDRLAAYAFDKKTCRHVFFDRKTGRQVVLSLLLDCFYVLFELRGVDPILMFNLYFVCSKIDQQSIVYTCCGKIIDKLNGVGG